MKVAYFILAHKQPNQLKRFLEAIYAPQHYYLIHTDAKAHADCHRMAKELAGAYPNVERMKSINCRWSGYSQVRAHLLAIPHMLQMASDWSFFITLSGQDFPLRSQEEIVAYLSDKQEHNFVEYFDPMKVFDDKIPRHLRISLEVPFRKTPLEIPRLGFNRDFLIGGARVYAGSGWFNWNRAFCEYLAHDKEIRKYEHFFRFVPHSIELFFQTVLMNSEFRETVINDDLRQINWSEDKPNPRIYTIDDYDELMQSSKLFARKFDEVVDTQILSILESKIQQSPVGVGSQWLTEAAQKSRKVLESNLLPFFATVGANARDIFSWCHSFIFEQTPALFVMECAQEVTNRLPDTLGSLPI